jgi:branched-subunit amino acid aminotransferase/4-amino-4-deoxychorismate lyase
VKEFARVEIYAFIKGLRYEPHVALMLVYVINRSVQTTPPDDLKNFMLQTPRGAYTTMLVRNQYFAINWPVHVERLVKSLAALHATLEGGYYDRYYESLQVGTPNARHAENSHSAILSHSQPDLVPTTQWSEPSFFINQSNPDHLQSNSLPERSLISAVMLPSILTALHTANDQFSTQGSRILTVILCPGRCGHSLDVHVATAPYSADTAGVHGSGGAYAVILGPPREVPIGKDTGWVAQRQKWEALKPPEAAEVLLCRQDGALLEGMVTNLYIIKREEANAAEGVEGRIVLQTAGMDDGVAWGTIRKAVLHACNALGLPVVETPPDPGERAKWSESFLTNALRGVQPLQRIECGAANAWGLPTWSMEFSSVPGPWSAKIARQVEMGLPCTDLRNLSR